MICTTQVQLVTVQRSQTVSSKTGLPFPPKAIVLPAGDTQTIGLNLSPEIKEDPAPGHYHAQIKLFTPRDKPAWGNIIQLQPVGK